MKKNVTEKLSNNVLLETLENRAMMSAVALTQGVLVLQGESGSANKLTISVDSSGQWVTATANDVSRTFNLKDVQIARLIGGELGDAVDTGTLDRPTYVRTGAGNDNITTGNGSDTIVSGNGDDRIATRGGDDFIDDGAGNDTVDTGPWDDPRSINTSTGYQVRITSFSLINADTDQVIAGYESITSGATIDLSKLPTRRLNIKANYTSGGDWGSILFMYDGGQLKQIENNAPYALAGDGWGHYYAWTPSTGTHVLEATPYCYKGAVGSTGDNLVVSFNVTDDPTQAVPPSVTPPTVTPPVVPPVTPAPVTNTNVITALTLYNADTDQPIMALTNGAEIDFAKIGTTHLSVVATTGAGAQSVRFALDGNGYFQTENIKPYAIAGDNWGDLNGWTPALGSHTITATPFQYTGATGAAGQAMSVTFKVTNTQATPSAVTPPPVVNPPVVSNPAPGASPTAKITAISQNINVNQSVFVNAVNSALNSGDWIHARAEWNFGDATGKYNNLVGFNAAHQYTAPGTYTVTLKLTNDAGKSVWTSIQVNVAAANRRVIYVSNFGDDNNSGTSPNAAIKTFARASQLVGDNTEILFERNGNFTATGAMNIGSSNVVIGAYGTGSRPVIKYTGVMTLGATIINLSPTARDVAILGITFDSIGDANAYEGMARAIAPSGTGVTIRDNQFLNLADAINAAAKPAGMLVQDNTAPIGIRGYFTWAQGSDHAYLGNYCLDSMYQHVIRNGGTDRMLIAYNDFTNAGTTVIKGTLNLQKGSFMWITNNHFSKGTLALGPLNGADGLGDKSARLYNVVLEQNQIISDVQFHHGLEHVMARDNIIYKNDDAAFHIDGFNTDYGRGVVDAYMINNTAINSGDHGNFVWVGGDVAGITMTNNVYSAPRLLAGQWNAAPVFVVDSDLSSFRSIKDNVWPAVNATPFAEGGMNYVGYGMTSGGYLTPAEWDAYWQVEHDQFAMVMLGTTGQVYLGGITAGSDLARAA